MVYTKEMSRTHVLLPHSLVEEIDKQVGQRKRSEFLAEAAREKLARLALLEALEATAGVLKEEDYPEWKDSASVASWVEALRAADLTRENEQHG